ncbi:hypothetical protein NQ315_001748 [Exocentrus adspersus]|uniref:tRNA-splicing endonuclease subunit Sen54 N-terminal domain-containing protein n=1 Tax=Exocentrus adspersus TaxID=1586481 RepID=A0AAV8W9J5_9CUCU|nr:hypothetical protein NQ315_001748 [Exocentrus adspersus]
MDILAKKLIDNHRNPLVKVDLPGSKLFLKPAEGEETEFIEKHQNSLHNVLNHERAERRCARSQAVWLPEVKLAKLVKSVKTINLFGYQDRTGSFLYPEEALFLMETNRLELTFNGVPLSIQEGYDLLLRSPGCSLLKYRVYKKLARFGYRLFRYSEVLRRLSKASKTPVDTASGVACNEINLEECARKRVIENRDESLSKKQKLENLVEDSSSGSSCRGVKQLEMKYIENVFEKLQSGSPKEYKAKVSRDETPDYCVFLPSNKSRCSYDFCLYICEESILKRHNSSSSSIFAICSEGNIAFYKFFNITLPFLL